MAFFNGFTLKHVAVDGGDVRLRAGGDGPPILMLHGNPQTHAMWHRVAPQLAERFTVICPDLRGYGQSFKPTAGPDNREYAKRAMAADMVQVMDALGFKSFDLVGHDRGGRVAHRLTLDYPDRVKRLAVLDIIPTLEHFERADMAFGLGYYHWFWFAQPAPFPENVISAAPEAWFRAHTSREPKDDGFFHSEALADYMLAVHDPEMIRGMCSDYRAAASIDLEHDRESRKSGEKIQCPLLALWGANAKLEQWYDTLSIWREYSVGDVSGAPVTSGHYLAEESPDEVLAHFDRFFD